MAFLVPKPGNTGWDLGVLFQKVVPKPGNPGWDLGVLFQKVLPAGHNAGQGIIKFTKFLNKLVKFWNKFWKG